MGNREIGGDIPLLYREQRIWGGGGGGGGGREGAERMQGDKAIHNYCTHYYTKLIETVPSLYAGPSWSEGSVFHPGSGTAVI